MSKLEDAIYIYRNFLRKGLISLDSALNAGMVAKKDLVDGHTYQGYCRNATQAVWNAQKQVFVYTRTKFGSSFEETINHPEDDNGFDIFVPIVIT